MMWANHFKDSSKSAILRTLFLSFLAHDLGELFLASEHYSFEVLSEAAPGGKRWFCLFLPYIYILKENMENIYLASLIILILVLLFAGIAYAIVFTLNELYETASSLLKKRIIATISIILLLSFLYSLPIFISHF